MKDNNCTNEVPRSLTGVFKFWLLLIACSVIGLNGYAQLGTVAVTGFNNDVVASGVGPGTALSMPGVSNPTIGVDGGGFTFIDNTYKWQAANALPTCNMPVSGLAASAQTPGLTYAFQSYSALNALTIDNNSTTYVSANSLLFSNTGTLALATPASYTKLYVLFESVVYVSPLTVNVVVTFTDASTQTFTSANGNLPNWFDNTLVAFTNVARAQNVSPGLGSTCPIAPNFFEMPLVLNPANYGKQVQSINFTIPTVLSSGTTPTNVNYFHAMAVDGLSPCATPTFQPTLLTAGATSTSQIGASFTAATGSPSGYLTVQYPNGATPSLLPADGTTYTAGQALGNGIVVQASNALSFTASGLSGGTSYDFYTYSYNTGATCGGPVYLSTSPLTGTFSTNACGTLTGTIPVGPTAPASPNGFPSLTAALAYINVNGLGGNTILELQTDYDVVAEGGAFPITFPLNPCVGVSRTLTVRPASGVGAPFVFTGSNATAIFDFNGATYVTIDGRPGGTGTAKMISIVNTSTAAISTVRLINDASNNLVTYCDMQGSSAAAANPTTAGVIFIGSTTGANGNDNNTISFCDVHGAGASLPGIGIGANNATAVGTPANNDNNTITGCNIYDFFLAAANATGIKIDQGNNNYTITNNHIYQTASRAFTAATSFKFLWLNSNFSSANVTYGSGNTVTGNYFGGTNAAGTGVMTVTSTSTSTFAGMDIMVGNGAATIVDNNTITNISFSSTNTNTGAGQFSGITVGYGNVSSLSGNTVGASGSGITVVSSATALNALAIGIRIGGGIMTNTINNNQIGNINCNMTVTSQAHSVYGIFANGGTTTLNVTNNNIGPLTSGTTATTATGAAQVIGIGTSVTNVTPVVTGNTIHDLSNYAPNSTTTGTGISIIGINLNGASINSAITVSGNTIYNLRNTAVSTSVTFAPQVQGVYISTAAASTITANANNIHSFSVPNWTPSGSTTGIPVFAGINIVTGSTSTLTNNIIRLGVDGNGASVTQPVSFRGIYKTATTGTMNAYHNSVYIGGTGVSASTAATQGAAFFRAGTATADDIRNNIFMNVRENATTGIKNYAIYLGANTALTLNYNVYYKSGSPTNFFAFNGSDVSLYTPSWVTGDANSWNQNPQFMNPTGTSATVDLHINPAAATPVEGLGINIPSVTLDFDGLTRAGLTPVDIGAYAGNFTGLSACVTPADQPTALVLTPASISQINGSFTAAASLPDAYIVVKYNAGATPTAPVNGAAYVAGNTLGSGVNTGTILSAGSATTFSATGLFGGTAYDFYVYAYNKNCTGGPLYNLITPLTGTQSTSSCAGLSGIVQVGPTAPASPAGFATLTSALAYLNINGLGASTVLELQGDYVSTSETFPITIGNIQCAGPSKTLTIRPAGSVVTPLVITSANTTATIDINGGMYVKIDGRPGGSGTNKYLIVENTSSTASSAGNAILMRNEASLDTITYCEVRSANANVASNAALTATGVVPGAITIGTTTGASGNDNNVISFCNVHSLTPGGNLGACIYSGNGTATGSPANNDNNTIDNCNIYDFYLATTASAGINVSIGNNNWTITNNHVYLQNAANYGAGTQIVRGMWVTPNLASLTSASGFNISGNYIGGNTANGTGTYTMTGTAGYSFLAMDISVGLGAATSVQNNTVTNINMTTSNTGTSAFAGINIANGNINCGTIAGNLIGSKTANGSITFTNFTNGGGLIGIRTAAGSTLNIANNTISGIDLLGGTTAITPVFSGITATGGTTINITNDTIGSATLVNSINAVTASVSTTAQTIRGIMVNGGTTSVVSGNFISNMNTNIVATGSQGTTMNGISVSLSSSTVTGNTITNLTSASQTTATGTLSPIVGIAYTATTAPATISGNNIHSLKLTSPSTSAAILLTGISYAGPTTGANSVNGNNIHNLSLSALNNSVIITGINAFGGTATYSNNMISLGYDETGASVTAGVQFKGIVKAVSIANSFYFNSVFIGGSNVISSGVNSYSFQRNTAPGSGVNDIIENNILVNNRSNATTGGKHYAMYLATASFLTLDYNDYYGNGNGYVFGFNPTADVPSFVSNWFTGDAHSYEFDPLFINPAGNAATTDLHINPVTPTIVEGSGLNIGSITTDFDGQTRSALTPTDMGADAGNFTGLSCTGVPDSANAYLLNASPICGSGSKTISLSGFESTPGLTYQWQESATGLPGSFTDVTTGSGGASNTYNTPVLTSSQYYQCRINCINSTDTLYSSVIQIVVNPSPVLTVTPLTGSNVCSNSKVDLTASGANSYTWAVNPGVTGYPIVSLLTSLNTLPTVTSVPTDSLSSNTANPPSKVSTHVWTYTVTGTSAAGCTSTASTVLNVIPSATPLTITYSTTPASVCAPGTPVTLTVNNPGSIGAGQWTYNWYDNTGNTLLQSTTNAASTNSYTPSTPAVDGEYRNVVKVSNSVCPASYASAATSYFVGYTTTESVTNSNCGDNGIVKVFPEGQNSYSNWYVNDFSTGLLGAGTIDNSYTNPTFNMFTGGVCVLTPMALSTNGAFLIRNPNQINTNNLQIDYTVSTNPLGFAFNILGGGAYAWSYAPDVWQGTLTPSTGGFNAENGSGSGIKIAFDGTANTPENAPGAYLMYNCQTIDQGPNSAGVIAFNPGNWWLGLVNAPVSITISETGKLTLKVNNMIVFDHVQLPASYLAANKSTWMHTFTARTGGANLYNPIDDLKIRYNSYQYSLNSTTGLNGTWQSSNTFSGLAAGTYPVWVRNPSDTTCFAKTDSATIGVNPSPTSANAIAAPGFNTTVCVGSVTKLTTDVAVPGAIFLWEESSAIGGPYIPAAGTNNQANYTTPGLASSTYYRCTFTCPAGSPITSTPIQVVVNIGSVASTNSPQLISCQGGSATLTATPGPNTTIVWYANPTGGTALTTGNSLTVTPATLPAIYYVEPATTLFTNHFDNGGVSVTGNGLGSVLNASGISTRFTTSGAIRIDSIKVMPAATGTLVVALQNSGSATNIATYSMSVTTTGSFINVPVNFIVNGSGSYQLTTTGPVCAYYNPFNGTYSAPYMFMGGVMTIVGSASTPTGGTSTSLYGTAFNWSITTSCPIGSGTRVPVQVNVDPSTIISVSPATSQLCQGGISQLTASSSATYNTYTWLPIVGLYTDAAATIPYTTGLNASTVYAKPLAPTQYVVTGTVTSGPNTGCTNTAKGIVDVSPSPAAPNILSDGTIVCSNSSKELTAQSTTLSSYVISGTSPTTTSSIPNPFYRGFEGAHQQYLIRASELSAAGILPGGLTSVSFNVTSVFPNNTQSAYTVKAGFTLAADLSAAWIPGLPVVSGPTDINSVVGANTFLFNSPVIWDGVSNLVIEICWDNDPTNTCTSGSPVCWGATSTASVATAPFAAATRYYYADNNTGVRDLCSSISLSGTAQTRPVMTLGYGNAVAFEWSPATGLNVTTGATVIASPSVATVYTVTASNVAGCTTTNSIALTVTAAPQPVMQEGDSVLCSNDMGFYMHVLDNNAYAGGYPAGTNFDFYGAGGILYQSGTDNTFFNANNSDAFYAVVTLPGYLGGCNSVSDTSVMDFGTSQAPQYMLSTDSVKCYGESNGKAIAEIIFGGTPRFRWQWYNSSNVLVKDTTSESLSDTLSGMPEGMYTFVLTDHQDSLVSPYCSVTDSIYISQPFAPLSAIENTASHVDLLCNGDSNGAAEIIASGGTPDYFYNWSNGETTSNISGLTAGDYTCTITDLHGCSSTLSVTITEPAAIVLNCTATNASCFGSNNGAVSVSAAGGTNSFSYLWSNGATTSSQGGLAPGTYTVTVTDDHGCSQECTSTVSQSAPFTVIITGNTAICQGSSSILDAGAGYTAYSWSTGATTRTITVSTAATYSVIATNAGGCTGSASVTTTVNPKPVPTISGANVVCSAASTTITASAGFTSYAWSTGATTQAITVGAGTYTVTVTNASGCTGTASKTITVSSGGGPAQPGAITGPTAVCKNGDANYSIAAVASATGYTWTATGGATISSGQGTTAVVVHFSNTAVASTLSVVANNLCGTSAPRTLSYTVSSAIPAAPSTITGTLTGVCNQTISYSCPVVTNASSYLWTVPTGATIMSGQGTNTVSVKFTSTFTGTGTISVMAQSGCGNSAATTRSLDAKPAQPVISGLNYACQYQAGMTYSVAPIAGVSSYIWTVVAGSTIVSGQGTTSIVVNWGGINGVISCKATNGCGNSLAAQKPVSFTCREAGNDLFDFSDVSLYPNPASSVATAQFEAYEEGNGQLYIYDLTGREVFKENIAVSSGNNQFAIDLNAYRKGSYIVKVVYNGNTRNCKLIVD